MEQLVDWWLNYKILSEKDLEYLNTERTKEFKLCTNDSEYDRIVDEYFSRMPLCNISSSTHTITFDESATTIINQLFKKYVDDETLVIYSQYEHPAAMDNIKNCKNKLMIENEKHFYPLNTRIIAEEAKKYKKLFVYIIGTQISTGEIHSQPFFIKLRKDLDALNIPYKLVIDDVHGIFHLPRDYSIFDYVIATAHATVRKYDMGICISKTGDVGKRIINWSKDYLPKVDMILERKDKLMIFRYVMEEYFTKYLVYKNFSLIHGSIAPHIFALKSEGLDYTKSMYNKLLEKEVFLEGLDTQFYQAFRLRACQYITMPWLVKPALKEVDNVINVALENNDQPIYY